MDGVALRRRNHNLPAAAMRTRASAARRARRRRSGAARRPWRATKAAKAAQAPSRAAAGPARRSTRPRAPRPRATTGTPCPTPSRPRAAGGRSGDGKRGRRVVRQRIDVARARHREREEDRVAEVEAGHRAQQRGARAARRPESHRPRGAVTRTSSTRGAAWTTCSTRETGMRGSSRARAARRRAPAPSPGPARRARRRALVHEPDVRVEADRQQQRVELGEEPPHGSLAARARRQDSGDHGRGGEARGQQHGRGRLARAVGEGEGEGDSQVGGARGRSALEPSGAPVGGRGLEGYSTLDPDLRRPSRVPADRLARGAPSGREQLVRLVGRGKARAIPGEARPPRAARARAAGPAAAGSARGVASVRPRAAAPSSRAVTTSACAA